MTWFTRLRTWWKTLRVQCRLDHRYDKDTSRAAVKEMGMRGKR